jgi:Tol biopolymer transport system component
MLRLVLLICSVLLILTFPARASDADRRLCFSRDEAVWVSDLDGTGARQITKGADPAISPDGHHIAYTELGKGTVRHIGVIDLGSGAKSIFRNLPSDNAYGAVWSPEGKQLVYYESPAWAVDGKTLYTQDLTNIYRIDLSGKVLIQWKISESLLNADMNSNNRIEPAADDQHLLLDADLDKDGPIKN